MAYKLFCNVCKEFIKEVTKGEIQRLPDVVTCNKCKVAAQTAIDEMKAVGKKGEQAIATVVNKWTLKMEEIKRQSIDNV